MAHHTVKSGYIDLVDRLNRFPQGAPPSDVLLRRSSSCCSASTRPGWSRCCRSARSPPARRPASGRCRSRGPQGARRRWPAAASWSTSRTGTASSDTSCRRRWPASSSSRSCALRGDIDQKLLTELFYQYLNVEEDFVKALFTDGETQLGRVFVQEPVLSARQRRSTCSTTSGPARSSAPPPPRRGHLLLPPQDAAPGPGLRRADGHLHDLQRRPPQSLIKHGIAREIDAAEGLDLLRAGARAEPGAVRRERPAAGQLHLQLLRLLLRGDDRGATLRPAEPGPHHELPAA